LRDVAVGAQGEDVEALGVDLVGAQDDVELAGVQFGVESGGAGEEFESVELARVDPLPFETD
jgi:hypothetical protein